MAHVDDGQLNALLDGELTPEETRAVDAHVAGCAECARRLAEARAFLSEAGELLAVLTPPPRKAEEPVNPAPAAPVVPKTAKEIAVSVDGRTEMTPAIRPVFKHEVPAVPAPRGRRMPNLETMAWAASLVLCLGVGYLANEVYHLKHPTTLVARQPAQSADAYRSPPTDLASNSAAPAAAEPTAQRRAEAASRSAGPTASPASGGESRPAAQAPATRVPARPARAKPPASKPAADFLRPRPEQIASNAPTAPAAAPPAAAPAGERALSDLGGAAVPARARSAQGAGTAQPQAPPSTLDEASATTRAFAAGELPTTFRRATMEEAVQHLSGNIRLVDGMNPARVEIGPGSLVPGASPDREVVRVTYLNGTNRLVLDQQLGEPSGASLNGLMPGDTLVTALGSNGTQVRWLDRKFWLSLTGGISADSARVLVGRVR